jgi:hypothetical protein
VAGVAAVGLAGAVTLILGRFGRVSPRIACELLPSPRSTLGARGELSTSTRWLTGAGASVFTGDFTSEAETTGFAGLGPVVGPVPPSDAERDAFSCTIGTLVWCTNCGPATVPVSAEVPADPARGLALAGLRT